MKTTKIFMMAALALLMTSCSNDDNDQTAPKPNADGEITVTAKINVNDGSALTRAVADNGTTITSGLAVDEQIAVLFSDGTDNLKRIATVKSIAAGTATIEFTIPSTLADGTACTLVYPATAVKADNTDVDTYANLLAAQTGALGANLDVRKGTATILNDGTTASLSGTPSLAAQFAIFKLTLQDLSAVGKTATKFIVSDGSNNVITTVTPTSATGTLYVALPVLAAGTYWFNATIDNKPYIAKATVATATTAGNYYQSTVKLATIGDVILTDGKFAAKGSYGEQAVIAYVGKVDKYFDKFLAIALEDVTAPGQMCTWATALTKANAYATNHPITIGGTTYDTSTTDTYYDKVASDQNTTSATRTTGVVKGWRMPSVTDWRYIFDGIGRIKNNVKLIAKKQISGEWTTYSPESGATPTNPLGVVNEMYYYKDGDALDASSLRAAINEACGNTALQSNTYWSSSEYSDDSVNVWRYRFSFGGFWCNVKTNTLYVRAVFAY